MMHLCLSIFLTPVIVLQKMAGVVPFSSCAPGRKQWNIRDRKSVKRSRSQLAEDGCPESQLVLAKQLLQERGVVSVNDNDSEENARLGVFWLIKASEQGNVEATNILKECLERGEGITEHNYLDVKSCLSTSQNEKLAKRAAREMFFSLSAGQDFITSEQLRRRMSKINLFESQSKIKGKRNENNSGNHCIENEANHRTERTEEEDSDDYDFSVGWTARGDNFGEKLTEDHLENAASTYSRGELPLVQRVLTLTDPQRREIENLNYLQRTLFHPFLTIQQAYSQLLDKFSSRCRNRSFNLLPGFSHLQIFIILILYPLISFETLIIFVPMFVYYFSYLVMVISTLQMLQTKKEYSNFRVWSRLFLSYDRGGDLNTNDAEFEYCKKNLKPFGVFFLSLLINLVVYPFISEFWIPQSEFAIVAFALTFTTLYSFHERCNSRRIDFLMLFSFGINVLAKYPYETDGVVRQTWRFLDLELPSLQNYGLPCFASQIVGNGVEFCLNFRGFFYLLIPGIFLKMAYRDNWKGTYKVLIPHCVTLSWWQVAVLCCQGATLYGLLRSTLALVGLIFFLPIVSLATLVLPVIAVLKHFADAALTPKTTVTTILASIPLILGYFIDKRRGVQLGTYLSKIQIFLAIVSAFFLICQPFNNFFPESNSEAEMQVQPTLTWEHYSTICQRSNWDKRGVAEIQHECVHFNGVNVNWEGTVENVRIVSVQNTLLKVLDNLPESVKSRIICLYGEKYEEDCSEISDEKKHQMCQTVKQINPKNKCHVRSWNKYEFEISLKMKSGRWSGIESIVELRADDTLRNFTLNLKPKDHIWFSGFFNYPETIGSDRLKLTADELGCINCDDKSLTSLKKQTNKITKLGRGMHRVQMLFPLLLGISGRLATLVPTAFMGLFGIFLFVAFSKKAFIISLIALFLTYLDRFKKNEEKVVYIHRIHAHPPHHDHDEDFQQEEEHIHYHWPYKKHYNNEFHQKNTIPYRNWKRPQRRPYHPQAPPYQNHPYHFYHRPEPLRRETFDERPYQQINKTEATDFQEFQSEDTVEMENDIVKNSQNLE